MKDNADYEITENDLAEWERMNQRKLDPLIILWTGWGSRFPDSLRYLGTESETDTYLYNIFLVLEFQILTSQLNYHFIISI